MITSFDKMQVAVDLLEKYSAQNWKLYQKKKFGLFQSTLQILDAHTLKFCDEYIFLKGKITVKYDARFNYPYIEVCDTATGELHVFSQQSYRYENARSGVHWIKVRTYALGSQDPIWERCDLSPYKSADGTIIDVFKDITNYDDQKFIILQIRDIGKTITRERIRERRDGRIIRDIQEQNWAVLMEHYGLPAVVKIKEFEIRTRNTIRTAGIIIDCNYHIITHINKPWFLDQVLFGPFGPVLQRFGAEPPSNIIEHHAIASRVGTLQSKSSC